LKLYNIGIVIDIGTWFTNGPKTRIQIQIQKKYLKHLEFSFTTVNVVSKIQLSGNFISSFFSVRIVLVNNSPIVHWTDMGTKINHQAKLHPLLFSVSVCVSVNVNVRVSVSVNVSESVSASVSVSECKKK
jgi:hypothetical protein